MPIISVNLEVDTGGHLEAFDPENLMMRWAMRIATAWVARNTVDRNVAVKRISSDSSTSISYRSLSLDTKNVL